MRNEVVRVMTGFFVVAVMAVRFARALWVTLQCARVSRDGRWKPERLTGASEVSRGRYSATEFSVSTAWPRRVGGCFA